MITAGEAKMISIESKADESQRIAEICEDHITEAAKKGKTCVHFRDLGYERRTKYKSVLETFGYKCTVNSGDQRDLCDILTVEW